jgi:uncharacterized membrane protein YdjX (TVP38/TMEM64 family)
MGSGDTPIKSHTKARSALWRVGGLALLLIAVTVAAHRFGWLDYQHALKHIENIRRSHSIVAFIAGTIVVFGLGTALGLPGLPFTVVAGVLFGTMLGTLLSWLGALLGATIGYWVARTVGHKEVLKLSKRVRRVDRAVEESRDFAGMLTLRLIPVLPIGTVNFVGGLARAPFWKYLVATAIGTLPSLIIYCYFADRLVEGVGSRQAVSSLIIASTLLIVLALAPRLVNRRHPERV